MADSVNTSEAETTQPEARRATDWEAIEREYRAGVLSVREIAKGAGVSHTIINRRAKERGWVRDVAALVKAAVSNKIVSEGVSNLTAGDVEACASRSFGVILSERKDIAKLKKIASELLDELEADAQKTIADRMSIKERADILERLSRIMVRLIQLERQAYGLDDTTKPPETIEAADATSPRNEVERRIARLIGP